MSYRVVYNYLLLRLEYIQHFLNVRLNTRCVYKIKKLNKLEVPNFMKKKFFK